MGSRRRQCGNVPRPAVQVAGLDRDIVDLERHSKRAFIQGQTPPEPLCELRAALVALAERHGATGRTLACAPRVGCVHRVYNIVQCCPKNTPKIAEFGFCSEFVHTDFRASPPDFDVGKRHKVESTFLRFEQA